MRRVRNIVIHCTATSQKATVSGIVRFWKERNRWKSPGYHRIIKPDGEIVNLCSFDYPTNGVAGHNHNSIHISFIGGLGGVDDRTDAQKASILECIREAVYYAPGATIKGHRDFPEVSKACPSFNAKKEYAWITA